MLEKEYQFFLDNKEDLIQKYLNNFIIIVNNEVVGSFEKKSDALKFASKNYETGKFLLEFCTTDKLFYEFSFVNWAIA